MRRRLDAGKGERGGTRVRFMPHAPQVGGGLFPPGEGLTDDMVWPSLEQRGERLATSPLRNRCALAASSTRSGEEQVEGEAREPGDEEGEGDHCSPPGEAGPPTKPP